MTVPYEELEATLWLVSHAHEKLKAKVREFVAVNEKLHYYLDAPAITYEEYCALGDRSEALYQEFKELVK